MKPIVITLISVALAFALAVSAAEDTSSGEDEVKTVTIKLTKAQIEKIANANGEDVTIKLTKKQVNAIMTKAPDYEGNGKLTLKSMHVGPGNDVVIVYESSGLVADKFPKLGPLK
ncbi:MAG: hypothetical protein GY771_03995 [bacterium]|nr:hypothetical protein [bacterium]